MRNFLDIGLDIEGILNSHQGPPTLPRLTFLVGLCKGARKPAHLQEPQQRIADVSNRNTKNTDKRNIVDRLVLVIMNI